MDWLPELCVSVWFSMRLQNLKQMLWSYIEDLELNMHKAERAVLYVTVSVMEKINI